MHFRHEGRAGRGFRFGPRGGSAEGGFGRHGLRFAMHFGGDGERGERGGRRRMFDGGELRLVLLKLIGEQPRHGYDLIRAIEERTGGAYAPSPGIVYPTLTLLSDMGLITEQQSEGSRKLFAITPEGEAHLAEKAAEVDAIFARLDALAQERERGDPIPVRRALGNLRSVLRHRLLAGEPDKAQLHEIAALIDEVAQKIERL